MSSISAKKKTIGVLFGSRSVEHDVSIVTAQQVMRALSPDKYDVVPIYITRDGRWITGPGLRDLSTFKSENIADMMGMKDVLISPSTQHRGLILTPISGWFGRSQLRPLDVVFPAIHGTHGEDGTIQGLCELADLPYVGAGVMASAVTRDKIMLKSVMQQHGIPVVKHLAFTRHDWTTAPEPILARIAGELGYPIFVKPATLGSSIGVARATTADEARNYINIAANFDRRILIEAAVIEAVEINCAVMGNHNPRPSVLEQPITWQEFLTYEEKYMRGEGAAGMKGAERKIPAPIGDALTAQIQALALTAFQAVDGRGIARLDFLARPDSNEIFLNEINTMPGSLAFYLWQEMGMAPGDVVDELVRLAEDAHAEKRRTVYNYKTGLIAHAAARGLKGIKK